MARPRIFLADDHVMLVDAFRTLLEPEFEIVGTAADGRTLVTAAPELKPDLIAVNLGLPLMNGIDAGQQLKAKLPKTKLLVITMNDDHLIASERSMPAKALVSTAPRSQAGWALPASYSHPWSMRCGDMC